MDENDLKEWGIVYLQHIRYPDTNEIDFRMNGRPYLIYKMRGDMAYIFLIRSQGGFTADEFYYPITTKSSNGRRRESYVSLRYVIPIKKSELIHNANAVKDNMPKKKFSKIKCLATQYCKGIEERIELLCVVDSYRQQIESIPD